MKMLSQNNAFTIIFILYLIINFNFNADKPENKEGLDVIQLIKTFGYPVEIHEVTTEDGYILTLHRIPNGKTSNSNNQNRIPILFMHGILNSAAEFVNLGPEKALSLLLADKNYDIWLGNARGSTWSRKHKEFDPDEDKKQFWNFSFHEIGRSDVPSMIDYILKETKHPKLHYVGYSQGTIAFFIMASEKSEYMEKIRLMTAMAPALYVNFTASPVAKLLGYYYKTIEKTFDFLDIHEFSSNDSFISTVLKNICDENSWFLNLCLHSLFIFQGYNYEQLNTTMLSRIYFNLPAGSSVKQINHLSQFIATGQFAQYDLGPEKNFVEYGQTDPPLYNVSRGTIPVAVYYGLNDWIVGEKGAETMIKQLPNVVKTYVVPHDKFNHIDFLHGIDADTLLYNSIIKEIEKY